MNGYCGTSIRTEFETHILHELLQSPAGGVTGLDVPSFLGNVKEDNAFFHHTVGLQLLYFIILNYIIAIAINIVMAHFYQTVPWSCQARERKR